MGKTILILTAVMLCGGIAGCSSPAEKAYKACKAQFNEAIEKTRADGNSKPAAKPLIDAGLAMMESMRESTCTAVRKVCEDDPKGQSCKAALEGFNK